MTPAWNQRMPEELHGRIKKLAQDYGTSVNEMVNIACEEFLRSGKIEALENRIETIEKEIFGKHSKPKKNATT